jgi:hypothetical protein
MPFMTTMRDNIALEIKNGKIPRRFFHQNLLSNPLLGNPGRFTIGYKSYALASIQTGLNNMRTGPGSEQGNHVAAGNQPHYIKHHDGSYSLFETEDVGHSEEDDSPIVPPPVSTTPIDSPDVNCSEVSYYGFVRFIVERLSTHREQSYAWSYSIKDPVDWLHSRLLTGEDLLSAGKTLSIAGHVMHGAINSKDQDLCYECVRLIMDWGGVYYSTGQRQGNEKSVSDLHLECVLLEKIICDYQRLSIGKPKNINLMNAGWTKVWAVLCPDDFVIFDSRVSFAFSKLLKEYCDLSCPQKDNSGNYNFANDLGYRQIKQSHRDVAGFKAVNANAAHWASSMLLVSDILKSCLAYANVIGVDICRYSPKNLRSLEARLFVMGK